MASNSPRTGDSGDITIIGAMGHAQVQNLTVVGRQYITGKVDVEELQKQTREDIERWTQGTTEPSSLQQVLEKIRSGSSCVTITGSPGEGKTTLGYLVLSKLQETRNVYKVISPDHFAEVIKTCAPVIVLDDIFGQTIFNETDWKKWKEILQKFIDLKETKPTNEIGNLILIARDFVLKSGARNTEDPWEMLISKGNVVNISSEGVRGNEEKMNILIAIAKKYKVNLDSDTIKEICSIKTPHGFPHTCKMFITNYYRSMSADDFFKNPIEFLKKSLKTLIRDEVTEHIFIEMTKGDGHVLKSELSECGYKYITTASDLCPTYLKPGRDGYLFDHPSIMDTIAFLLCETKLSFILTHCSMKFILQRIWLETPDGEKRDETGDGGKLMTKIPWNEAEELATRFRKEITAGNYVILMFHNAWKSDSFVKLLIQSMTEDELNARDMLGWTLLYKLCQENRADRVKMCVQRGAHINSQNEDGSTALHIAAGLGLTEVVRALLECGANVNITDKLGQTPLDLATLFSHSEIVSVLRAAGGRSTQT